MSGDIVIRAEDVSKIYRLGAINHGTLYRDLQSWWAKFRRRPDPNVQIRDMHSAERPRLTGDVFRALDDVSFEAERGDIVGIIGRNGAANRRCSRLSREVTGPTSGTIKLKGRVASLLEVGTGFHPELTGRENVFLNGTILGMTRREVDRKFDEIVAFAEIEDFIDTPVKRYSSGMYVRLAFSVAAHLEPEILVVDEVLAVGDLNFQKKCLGRMQEVGKSGRTILFVSHNMTAVSSLCRSALLISEGRLTASGQTADVIKDYLRESEQSGGASYARDPTLLDGKAVIYKAALLDKDNARTATIELMEPFAIEIEYELRESMSGLRVGMQILADDGSTAIISLSDPELDQSRLDIRKAGRYETRIELPKCLLNTGSFFWRVGISSAFSIYSTVEGLRFDVRDSVGIIQMLGQYRKPSISALQFPWQVERI